MESVPIDLSIDFVSATQNGDINNSSIFTASTGDIFCWVIFGLLGLLAIASLFFIRAKVFAKNVPTHSKTNFTMPLINNKPFSRNLFVGFIVLVIAIFVFSGALMINKAFADVQGGVFLQTPTKLLLQ